MDNPELRFVLPAKQTSTQLVKDTSSSSSAFMQVLPEFDGNQEAYFRFDSLAPREDRDIRIGIDLRLSESLILDVAEDRSRYLADDPLLDLSHPNVQALASELLGEEVDISIDNILGWLEEHRKEQSSVPDDRGPRSVGANTAGQAIDDVAASEILFGQSHLEQDALYLFNALSRAMKVPSRVVVGLNTGDDSKSVYTFDDLIIYTEIFLNENWRAVDLGDHELIETPQALTLRRLAGMPARQEVVQPYRLLFQSVGVEFVLGSEKYRFSSG